MEIQSSILRERLTFEGERVGLSSYDSGMLLKHRPYKQSITKSIISKGIYSLI